MKSIIRIVPVCLFFLFLSCSALYALYPSDDLLDIQRTLNYYYEGAALHSVEVLARAYHPQARMIYVDIQTGKYEKFEVGNYLSTLASTHPIIHEKNIRILSLDITGNTALVRTCITFEGKGMRINDFLTLHQTEGEWRIMSRTSYKEYASFEKPKTALWDKELAKDQREVNEVLNTYLLGGDRRDAAVLRTAFHPQAEVTYTDPRKETCFIVSLADYLHMYDSGENREVQKRKHEVVSVDITGNMAVAKIRIQYKRFQGVVTDYITLVKTEGSWSIILKATDKEKGAMLAPV
ncbi:MAG: nuclear transport factor 2 family protein [Bacteroidia bacterium]|nr:nuclear transport factor 2 family protein [Bacteroidia bacterium]